mmetsp:Transcript_21047/g.27383  ORF Transcript_21047/g.27383 Transcript_21047/m.27383 type:complete len:308 (-) Transcript_21047:33-956(-)
MEFRFSIMFQYYCLLCMFMQSICQGAGIPENPISITISPWGECDPVVCVQSRSVYCLDSYGKIESEMLCPGIEELKHYQSCDCSQNKNNENDVHLIDKNKPSPPKKRKPPTQKPSRSPTYSPTHDREAFYPDDEDDEEGSGMLVNSDVLTTLVELTKTPSPQPTPQPTYERTFTPTTNLTHFQHLKEKQRLRSRDEEEAESFSRVKMVIIAALLSFLVIFVIFLSMFCCCQGNSNTDTIKYSKVDVQYEDDNFDFPEDRDNPFEYFNEPEEQEEFVPDSDLEIKNDIQMVELNTPTNPSSRHSDKND